MLVRRYNIDPKKYVGVILTKKRIITDKKSVVSHQVKLNLLHLPQ